MVYTVSTCSWVGGQVIPRSNMTDELGMLAEGEVVRLYGLSSRADLNGSEGRIARWEPDAGRYVVSESPGWARSP